MRNALVVMVVVAIVGTIDAVVGSAWDLAVVLGAIAVVGAASLARSWSTRPMVPVRRDLVVWMDQRAALGGDDLGSIADRAVAAYRDGLTAPSLGGRVRDERRDG